MQTTTPADEDEKSKLRNVMFANELAKLLPIFPLSNSTLKATVIIHCVTPIGVVAKCPHI